MKTHTPAPRYALRTDHGWNMYLAIRKMRAREFEDAAVRFTDAMRTTDTHRWARAQALRHAAWNRARCLCFAD